MSFLKKIQANYAVSIKADNYDAYCKRLDKFMSKLKKKKQLTPSETRQFRLLAELHEYIHHIKPRDNKMYKFIEKVEDEFLDNPEKQDAEGFYDVLDEGVEFLKD